jgi:hypothetical protein
LTLTGYNAEYSDHTFLEKRDHLKGGFRVSPLKLNVGLGQLTEWNEDAIKLRAGQLAGTALLVWRGPTLPADVLARYRPEVAESVGYSINDHPNLSVGTPRKLFEALRKDVLALDPRSCHTF